jgi:hypothetical protein
MSYQLNYYVYRLEHGLSAAEQRAADLSAGQMAAALAEFRRLVAGSLGRGLRTVRGLGRLSRTGKATTVAVTALTER